MNLLSLVLLCTYYNFSPLHPSFRKAWEKQKSASEREPRFLFFFVCVTKCCWRKSRSHCVCLLVCEPHTCMHERSLFGSSQLAVLLLHQRGDFFWEDETEKSASFPYHLISGRQKKGNLWGEKAVCVVELSPRTLPLLTKKAN